MYQEVTVVNVYNANEIMIHVDLNTGEILEIYCYSDSIPTIYTDSSEHLCKTLKKSTNNSLFKYLDKSDFKKYCKQN